MQKITLLLTFLSIIFSLSAQYVPIGTWGDNLPYRNGIAVTYDKSGKTIYAASESAVFRYIKETEEINRINKINGLSATNISTIEFDNTNKQLVIAYTDGNVDILETGDNIVNMPYIRTSSIIGNKIINKIIIKDASTAYLACGFGIVVFNLKKKEVSETYIFGAGGSNVHTYDVAENDSALFAATENGLYYVLKSNTNLADFTNWQKVSFFGNKKLKNIVSYANKLIVHYDDNTFGQDTIYVSANNNSWNYLYAISEQITITNITVSNDLLMVAHDGYFDVFDQNLSEVEHIFTYNGSVPAPREVLKDEENNYWVADYRQGMEKVINNWNVEQIAPNGPFTKDCRDIDAINENVWVASGNLDNIYTNLYSRNGLNYFKNYEWFSINKDLNNLPDSIFDVVSVAINPNDVSETYAGSFGSGLLHFKNYELADVFNEKNSTLQNTFVGIRVYGLKFDENGNLWIVNSNADVGLHVRTPQGEWYGYNLSPYTATSKIAADIIIDKYGYKWITFPKNGEILIFDDNQTLDDPTDDRMLLLNGNTGQGAIPGTEIFSIEIDQDGQIWVGTDEGVVVFYNNYDMFDDLQDAQQIFIQQDGLTQILLETESVSAIAIDGANRKWFGTRNSGVYVMSEDATQQINHFYTDNSPIFSNNILDIAANYKTGEIYIGTDEGIITYKTDATAPTSNYDSIYVYPNPVREDYDGLIAIRGLLRNSNVKITDISGNLIYETKSLGGQAVWNGKDLSGKKVQTGIYLIFCNSPDGKQRKSSKIMVIN